MKFFSMLIGFLAVLTAVAGIAAVISMLIPAKDPPCYETTIEDDNQTPVIFIEGKEYQTQSFSLRICGKTNLTDQEAREIFGVVTPDLTNFYHSFLQITNNDILQTRDLLAELVNDRLDLDKTISQDVKDKTFGIGVFGFIFNPVSVATPWTN